MENNKETNKKLLNLVVIDVETSGTSPFVNQILSLSLVPLDQNIGPLNIFVRPESIFWGGKGEEFFSDYKDEWERSAVSYRESFEIISNYLKGFPYPSVVLVGHNVGFDYSFLQQIAFHNDKSFPKLSHRLIDTHTLLYSLYLNGAIQENDLSSSGAFEKFKISMPDTYRHTAYGDSLATKDLFVALIKKLSASHNQVKKDYSKYYFNDVEYGKGRLVLAVVTDFVSSNPGMTINKLKNIFPKYIQGSIGVLNELQYVQNKYEGKNHQRHFLKPYELIRLKDCTVAVSTEWSMGNIDNFIRHAKMIGYMIS